jgi:hypothetical protein
MVWRRFLNRQCRIAPCDRGRPIEVFEPGVHPDEERDEQIQFFKPEERGAFSLNAGSGSFCAETSQVEIKLAPWTPPCFGCRFG